MIPTPDRKIRPSSLTTAIDCPRRWAAQHLATEISGAGWDLNRAMPTGIGAHVGTGVHEAASVSLQWKMQDGTLGREADAIEAGIVTLRERIEREGVAWDEATDSRNTAEKQIQRMAKVYRRDVAPLVEPVLVEERLEAEFKPGWIITGQADLVAGDINHVLRDLKTGTRQRANHVQYGAYTLILQAHGYRPRAVFEDYIKRVPMKVEQPAAVAKPIDPVSAQQEAWEALEGITNAVEEFERRLADPNGRPPPLAFRANPASTLCSAKFCPAFGTEWCRAHSI